MIYKTIIELEDKDIQLVFARMLIKSAESTNNGYVEISEIEIQGENNNTILYFDILSIKQAVLDYLQDQGRRQGRAEVLEVLDIKPTDDGSLEIQVRMDTKG